MLPKYDSPFLQVRKCGIKFVAFAIILCIFLSIGIASPGLFLHLPGECKVYDTEKYKIAVLEMNVFMEEKLYVFLVENGSDVRKLAVINIEANDVMSVESDEYGIEITYNSQSRFSDKIYTEYITIE